MNSTKGKSSDYLYNLLPTVYRLRDFTQGEPLRALLAVIESEWQAVQTDISELYENWFIETCADWVIPYIGDLVGNRPLHEISQLRRTDVAKTLYYRRRKGTLAMLEEMARDVTGWGAHAVEFFQLLQWTQHLNHQRLDMAANPTARGANAVDRVGGTINLRSGDVVDRLNGPFDLTSHTVDVRPIDPVGLRQPKGLYNIRNIGFFLWRLRHYPLSAVEPRPSAANSYGYHLGTLSNAAPIFNNPQAETDDSGLAGEIHVPGPIRPAAFYAHPEQYYGEDLSVYVVKDGNPVPAEDVMCKDLSNWNRPPAGKVAIDVRLGRLAFAVGEEPADLLVASTHGFSADIGGGPYDRRATLAMVKAQPAAPLQINVAKNTATETLQDALQQWTDQGKPDCIIQVADNRVYGGNVDVTLPAGGWLAIVAADGARPDVRFVGTSSLTAPEEGASLIMNGLFIEGSLELNGALNLALEHCTLVPGQTLTEDGLPAFPDRDSIVVGTFSGDLSVTISASILGPIRLPADSQQLTIRDSIIYAPMVDGSPRPAIAASDTDEDPGPPTTLERVTIWGPVYVKEVTLASAVIFNHPVIAQRQQVGCVRFSYLPAGCLTPRRYYCQPDLALIRLAQQQGKKSVDELEQADKDQVLARVQPEYTSERYGDPGYAQLSLTCAEEITSGAEDGAEMGAFNLLKQPQRAANLRLRLQEYLPFGLQAGLIYVT